MGLGIGGGGEGVWGVCPLSLTGLNWVVCVTCVVTGPTFLNTLCFSYTARNGVSVRFTCYTFRYIYWPVSCGFY